MDQNQKTFKEFEVPDPIRITKAISFIKKYTGKLEGLKILECGVVKGGLADRLKDKNECFGIDINFRDIPGINIKQADLNREFPDWGVKFNIIFAGEVIEHLLDDAKFIKKCKTNLMDGGLLILTTPNLVFWVNRIFMLFGEMPMFAFAPYHYRIYNKKVLSEVICEAGLKILEFRSSHVLFSTRRNKLGLIFEILGDVFPALGAHLIICAQKS